MIFCEFFPGLATVASCGKSGQRWSALAQFGGERGRRPRKVLEDTDSSEALGVPGVVWGDFRAGE